MRPVNIDEQLPSSGAARGGLAACVFNSTRAPPRAWAASLRVAVDVSIMIPAGAAACAPGVARLAGGWG